MLCIAASRSWDPPTSRRTLWNWLQLIAHLLLLFLLAGDRTCGVQPVGVSGESRNASSRESTKPHVQGSRNSAASTKVGPLVSDVALCLGCISLGLPSPRKGQVFLAFVGIPYSLRSCRKGSRRSIIESEFKRNVNNLLSVPLVWRKWALRLREEWRQSCPWREMLISFGPLIPCQRWLGFPPWWWWQCPLLSEP